MKVTNTRTWFTDAGRQLVRLNDNGTATVVPSSCDAGELRELAIAAVEAADRIDDAAEALKKAGPPEPDHQELCRQAGINARF